MTGWRISFAPGYPRWIEAMDPMDPNHHGKTSSTVFLRSLYDQLSTKTRHHAFPPEDSWSPLASCNDRLNPFTWKKMLNMFNLTKTPLCTQAESSRTILSWTFKGRSTWHVLHLAPPTSKTGRQSWKVATMKDAARMLASVWDFQALNTTDQVKICVFSDL